MLSLLRHQQKIPNPKRKNCFFNLN